MTDDEKREVQVLKDVFERLTVPCLTCEGSGCDTGYGLGEEPCPNPACVHGRVSRDAETVKRLRELWRQHEWVLDTDLNIRFCVVCGASQAKGHDADCDLAAALHDGDKEPK